MIPDLRSSAARTEFTDCLYEGKVTVHCQAHGRCLECGEGCRECKQVSESGRIWDTSIGDTGAPVTALNSCGMALTAGKTSGYAPEGSAGIPSFDEEYGRTYRGRIYTGQLIDELTCAVMRAERGAGR